MHRLAWIYGSMSPLQCGSICDQSPGRTRRLARGSTWIHASASDQSSIGSMHRLARGSVASRIFKDAIKRFYVRLETGDDWSLASEELEETRTMAKLERINKNTVKAALRRGQSLDVILCGDNVNAYHVIGGWCIGCPITVSSIEELDRAIASYAMYMDRELGRRVILWRVI